MAVSKGPGWYAGTVQVGSAASRLDGGTTDTPTYFYWGKATVPTVSAVNVTDLVNITGGPFQTEADAKSGATHSAKGSSDKQTTPSKSTPGSSGSVNPLSGISSLEDVMEGLTSANLWIRVAKVTLGGALLLIGVAKLSGAGGLAAKVVKAAPLL